MKKLIYSRRGVAIELAIGVMFVMMALGIILVTNASLQNKQMNSDLADYEEKIEMYKITDWIIDNQGYDYNSGQPFEGYVITPNANTYTIKDAEGTTVLTIEVDGNKITSWN